MDFKTAAKFGAILSKDYAKDVFALLVNYQAISASEVAARVNLHIKTAQDFLESLEQLGLLSKEEVLEKKRPYFRYSLQQTRIQIDIDLMQVKQEPAKNNMAELIRERENAGARFKVARNGDTISNVTIWSGNGRDRQERRIKLTNPQGKFLFHLPFPSSTPLSIDGIMQKAGVDASLAPEILDLVQMLEKYDVIEGITDSSK